LEQAASPALGDVGEPEVPLDGGSQAQAVRVGRTVRRVAHPWSSSVLDLLQHVEREGYGGAPRGLGFDERAREVLTYVDGSVGVDLPDADAGPVQDADHWIWRDDVLVHLGVLVREYHDAAATFPWAGREWQVEVRQPVETVCHNDLAPPNVVSGPGFPWRDRLGGSGAWAASLGPRIRRLAVGAVLVRGEVSSGGSTTGCGGEGAPAPLAARCLWH